MVQLNVLSERTRGSVHVIPQLPFVIGRGAGVDWRLEESGVWDRHLQLDLRPGEGITATVLPGALATVNGQAIDRGVLRNGDVIQLGAAKLQFWFTETRQQSFRLREAVTWVGFSILCLGQILLIYRLLP